MMEKREKTEIPCRKVEKKTVIIVKTLERCPKPEKVMSKKCSKKLQAKESQGNVTWMSKTRSKEAPSQKKVDGFTKEPKSGKTARAQKYKK